jgi:hypothetical protein
MDALMRLMRQMHHDPMNTSMFDVEANSEGKRQKYIRRICVLFPPAAAKLNGGRIASSG